MKGIKKRFFYGLIMIIILSFSFFCIQLVGKKEIKMIMCDVGQGDAILVSYGSWQMLIDTGPDQKVLNCLRKNMSAFDAEIELLILTHFDRDHVGGFKHLMNRYTVKNIVVPESLAISSRHLGSQIINNNNRYKHLVVGQLIRLNNEISLRLVNPDEAVFFYSNLNDQTEQILSGIIEQTSSVTNDRNSRSIAGFLYIKKYVVFLTGDIDETVEKALIEKGMITKVNVLKVAHHGSKLSNSTSILKKLNPEVSLVSCGLNNKYGHPHSRVLSDLMSLGSNIWRTDENGDIEIVFHHEGIEVQSKHK